MAIGTPTVTYIDPLNGNNHPTGDGTSGNPFLSLQTDYNQITENTDGGNVIKMANSALEVLTADFDPSSQFTDKSADSPFYFENWDVGGALDRGGFDLAGYDFFTSANHYFAYYSGIHLESSGNSTVWCVNWDMIDCYLDFTGTSNDTVINCSGYGLIQGCYLNFPDLASFRSPWSSSGNIGGGRFFGNMLIHNGGGYGFSVRHGATWSNNIVVLNGTPDHSATLCGFSSWSDGNAGTSFQNNTLYHNAGTAYTAVSDSDRLVACYILNNVILGFTTGLIYGNSKRLRHGGNHLYNNTTNYSGSPNSGLEYGDNEDRSSGGSPIAESGSALTWANRETFYAPQDVGNMFGGSVGPWTHFNKDKGAVQRAGGGGGGGGGNKVSRAIMGMV